MKMNNLANGIAIDTNIFEHLWDDERNLENHIGILLSVLQRHEIRLIVDDKGRIMSEYRDRLENRLFFEEKHRRILQYWFIKRKENRVELNQNDDLMQSIKVTIPHYKGEKTIDRIFVYVTVKEDSVLVTNDRKDIIDEGNQRGERRKKILKMARKKGYKRTNIWDSEEAHRTMLRPVGNQYELNKDQVEWKSPAA